MRNPHRDKVNRLRFVRKVWTDKDGHAYVQLKDGWEFRNTPSFPDDAWSKSACNFWDWEVAANMCIRDAVIRVSNSKS